MKSPEDMNYFEWLEYCTKNLPELMDSPKEIYGQPREKIMELYARKRTFLLRSNHQPHKFELAFFLRSDNQKYYCLQCFYCGEKTSQLPKFVTEVVSPMPGISYDQIRPFHEQVWQALRDLYLDAAQLSYQTAYLEYLESPEWKQKREQALQRDNFVCQNCGKPATDVHHITYEHFRNEYLFELVSLCHDCHEKMKPQAMSL